MTDFETHPVGTAAMMTELQAAQKYRYIGKDGKPVLARDLEDRIEQLKAAHTRANAATAAAYEVAGRAVAEARVFADGDTDSETAAKVITLGRAGKAIHALATPDQNAALDRLIAEAEARVWKRAIQVVDALPEAQSPDVNVGVANAYAAILASSKKGGV